jgi:hypothetical protein
MASNDDDGGKKCTNATLKGSYGLHGSGIRPVAATMQSEIHETIALRNYDGRGGVTSMPIVSQGQVTGVTLGTGDSSPGTYEVNPDCTGKVTINLITPRGPVPIEAKFVIVNNGREIMEVPTVAGNVGAATLRRQ